MHTLDYEAVLIGNKIYCVECAPEVAAKDAFPIRPDTKCERTPRCYQCGQSHDYADIQNREPLSLDEAEEDQEFARMMAMAGELDPTSDEDFITTRVFCHKGYWITVDFFHGERRGTVEGFMKASIERGGVTLAVGQLFFVAPFLDALVPSLIIAASETGALKQMLQRARIADPEAAKVASQRWLATGDAHAF